MSLSRIKVQLAITKSYPVLLATLGPVSGDHRPDSLRSLALMGLHIEKGTAYVLPALAPTPVSGGSVTGEPNDLSFFVVLNGAIPSLYADFRQRQLMRADRLGLLASLGAAVESGRVEMRVSGAAPLLSRCLWLSPLSICQNPFLYGHGPDRLKFLILLSLHLCPVALEARDNLDAREKTVLPIAQIEDESSQVAAAVPSGGPSSAPAVSDRVGKSVRSFSRLLGED